MELKYIVFTNNEEFVRWQREWNYGELTKTLSIVNYFPVVIGKENISVGIFVVYSLLEKNK